MGQSNQSHKLDPCTNIASYILLEVGFGWDWCHHTHHSAFRIPYMTMPVRPNSAQKMTILILQSLSLHQKLISPRVRVLFDPSLTPFFVFGIIILLLFPIFTYCLIPWLIPGWWNEFFRCLKTRHTRELKYFKTFESLMGSRSSWVHSQSYSVRNSDPLISSFTCAILHLVVIKVLFIGGVFIPDFCHPLPCFCATFAVSLDPNFLQLWLVLLIETSQYQAFLHSELPLMWP